MRIIKYYLQKKKEVKLKITKSKTVFTLLLCFAFFGMQAQSVYVNESNGTQSGIALKNIRSITFNNGTMKVNLTQNTTEEFSLSGLSSLTFTEATIGTQETSIASTISVYPNPVQNILTVDLSNQTNFKNGHINILSINGQLVQTVLIKDAVTKIDVSSLAKGIYICSYNNKKETKTVKFIKQ